MLENRLPEEIFSLLIQMKCFQKRFDLKVNGTWGSEGGSA